MRNPSPSRLTGGHLSKRLTGDHSSGRLTGAVDIGGTKIAVGLVRSGTLLAQCEAPTADYRNPDRAAEFIAETLKAQARELGAALSGIGIGCTGPVDPRAGVVGRVDLLPGWEGFGLTDALSALCDVAVVMENDADAAALAEWRWGAGQGISRFIYVTISTGIGGGLIFDGQLYRGLNGAHPEIGHQTFDPSGPHCYCGANGCWESLSSGPALEGWYAVKTGNSLSLRDIFAVAKTDIFAQQAIERAAYYTGLGLANLSTVFCPDVIALGGGVMNGAALILPDAIAHARQRTGLIPFDNIRIVPALLGTGAPLLGAAAVFDHNFITTD